MLKAEELAARRMVIGPTETLEEDNKQGRPIDLYYPVRIDQIVDNRYKVVGKLGYGGSSTVWLARDIETNKYSVLKVYIKHTAHELDERGVHEINVHARLRERRQEDNGGEWVRHCESWFMIPAADGGVHPCLVYAPLGMSVKDRMNKQRWGFLPDEIALKWYLFTTLSAVDFLHRQAQIIHTDIRPHNLLHTLKTTTPLNDFETGQKTCPVARQILPDGRIVYKSRALEAALGPTLLADFSAATSGAEPKHHTVQAGPLRAPEVILKLPWSYPIDIWNIGCLIWTIFEPCELFETHSDGVYSRERHLADILAKIGPAPLDIIKQSEVAGKYWDENGVWKGGEFDSNTIEDKEFVLTKAEDKKEREGLLAFVRKCLKWRPEERATAQELLEDPWLCSEFT